MPAVPRWIQIANDFYRNALDDAPPPAELAVSLDDASRAVWSQVTAALPSLTASVTAPACRLVSVQTYAATLLGAWGGTLHEAFLVAGRADGTEAETRRALEAEQAEPVANASAGPIAMLAEWAVTPYELFMPLATSGMLPFSWKAVQTVVTDLDVPLATVVRYLTLEAVATYVCVERPAVSERLLSTWLEFLAAQEVDVDQLLGHAWKINPNRTSWSDGVIIVDSDAMINAFRGPEQLVPSVELARLTSTISKLSDQITNRFAEPNTNKVRDYLARRRDTHADFDYYLQASYGLTVRRGSFGDAPAIEQDDLPSGASDESIVRTLNQL